MGFYVTLFYIIYIYTFTHISGSISILESVMLNLYCVYSTRKKVIILHLEMLLCVKSTETKKNVTSFLPPSATVYEIEDSST